MALSALPPTSQHHGSIGDKNQDDSHDKDRKGPHPPNFLRRRLRLRCRICGANLNPQLAKPSPGGTQRKRHAIVGVHRYRSGGLIDCPFASHPYALPRQVNRMVIAGATAAAIPFGGQPAVMSFRPAPRSQPPPETTEQNENDDNDDNDDDDDADDKGHGDKHDNDNDDEEDDDDDDDDRPLRQATRRLQSTTLCSKACGKD